MHSGDVAVHTDAGHEADAHVDVGKVQRAREEARQVSEHPVVLVEVVVDSKGQRAEDQDVRHGQVADEDAEGSARRDPNREVKERRQVPWKTNDEGDDEDCGEEVILELSHRVCAVGHVHLRREFWYPTKEKRF